MTTPTIRNTDRQYNESPTRLTTVKTETVQWYLQQQQIAEQLRRIHGREN